jgi:hypothetical protein
MAGKEFTSRENEALYRLVVLLNGSLRFIVTRLEELATTKVLSPEYLKEMKRLTEKIETEITPKK